MFDQTFVDSGQKTRKPLTLFVSILMQICALCVVTLIPLIYTSVLPGAVLKSWLVAPPPPLVAISEPVPKGQVGRVPRVFMARDLQNPIAVLKQPNPASAVGAPPDITAAGTTVQDGSFGSPLLGAGTPGPVAPPLAEAPKPKPANAPIRVGTGAAEAKLINRVIPLYPPLAKAARVQGSVEFTAIISKEGSIENLQLVHGHPLLVNAARNAVLQWKYRPTLLNGQPVEVLTEIIVNLTLAQ